MGASQATWAKEDIEKPDKKQAFAKEWELNPYGPLRSHYPQKTWIHIDFRSYIYST